MIMITVHYDYIMIMIILQYIMIMTVSLITVEKIKYTTLIFGSYFQGWRKFRISFSIIQLAFRHKIKSITSIYSNNNITSIYSNSNITCIYGSSNITSIYSNSNITNI